MKIVIAPDSFKECLSAQAVAAAIAAGIHDALPAAQCVQLPLADGGEGTVDTLLAALGGQRLARTVSGPLGEPMSAHFGLTASGTAIVEMAAASGLALLPPPQRDPLRASSFGTGELIRAALDAGARHLMLGIGGSASNDGGAGLLQALGMRLLDEAGHEIPQGGAALAKLARIDATSLDPRLADCVIDVACDVRNPLLGAQGASAVYGPQKGATPAMVAQLDAALAHFAAIVQRDLGADVASLPGAGAGGGIGAGLIAGLGVTLRPGIEVLGELLGLDAAIRDADLVITGEGRIDTQTLAGKAASGVARIAQGHGKPVIAIGGSIACSPDDLRRLGFDAAFAALQTPQSLEAAIAQAGENLRQVARNIAALLALGEENRTRFG
ncbi:glycerate kinase [Niveibacterium sp. 24ML]|uniref:glycerate kinase n=1 Tax=Niveibacterium sp. 24ML TaxID=2985512 RepID=UPI0022700C3E|nr:glycerate kinase [Niveibacterium sp. 24ML]MCX9155690.1 glycerate kinase [Niveibacterium sp. 24ML]